MGAYTKDSSSLTPEYFANFRVISSHYHKKQDIKCGRPRKGAVGLFSYIGAPYSISFSEAGDGPKGFSIVYDDGTLELVPTNLRKHVKVERLVEDALNPIPGLNPEDLLWVVIKGPASEMDKLTRPALAKAFGISNFKLDKVPDEVTALDEPEEKLTDLQVFDRLVEQGTDGAEVKAELKRTARELMESAA